MCRSPSFVFFCLLLLVVVTMGQCCVRPVPIDMNEPRIVRRNTRLREAEMDDFAALAEAPAGRVPIEPGDDYVLIHYNDTLNDITKWSDNVYSDFQRILDCETHKFPVLNDIMRCQMTTDQLIKCYSDFLHDSAYQIDEHVQARKDIAVKGYRCLVSFKRCLDAQRSAPKKDFPRCQGILEKVYSNGRDLVDHFYSSYANPPKERRSSTVHYGWMKKAKKANKRRR